MRKAEYKAELLREIKMASETLSWKLSDEEHEGIKNYIKKDIEKYIKIKNGGYFMGMDYYIDGEKREVYWDSFFGTMGVPENCKK